MPTFKIKQDIYPENPRDNDNLCLMVCAHNRYNLGDLKAKEEMAKRLSVNVNNFSVKELVEKCKKKGLVFMSKPLYLYDHSGITMSTSPFSCPWDSGLVGEIICFKETVKNEFNIKRFGKKIVEEISSKIKFIIESEVKEYDSYISGDMYSLFIEDGENSEVLSGFIGNDIMTNGMIDYIPEEYLSQLVND